MLTTKRSTFWHRSGAHHRRRPLLRRLPAVIAVLVALSLNAPPAFAATTATAPGGTGPVTGSVAGSTTGGWNGRIDWRACSDQADDPGTRCGTLRLPVDWARPGGETFELALARRPAADPAARIGVLVFNPGGPGLSGVDVALTASSQLGPDVLRRFDIVGFDPRGTVRSAPVRCSSAMLARHPSLAPANAAEFERLRTYNRQLREDCRAQSGPLFDHIDSVSVARDTDAIRAALGERQLSFYEWSYGTLIGQAYAELYPDRVRALAMDSVMDHSQGVEGYFRSGAASNEALFHEFVTWCDRTPSCALHGRDVPALYDRLMRRADAGTLVDAGTGATLTWFELGFATFVNFFDSTWADLANMLLALERGEAADPPLASPMVSVDGDEELTEYALPAFCQDWSLPVNGFAEWNRYLELSRAAAPHLRASPLVVRFAAICLGWTAVNPQHSLRVRTSTPVLLLNGRYDPATPYDGAQRVARQLGTHGRLLTYEGSGHASYPRTECTRSSVDRYLVDRVLPPAGASCPSAPV
ncbi:pimeloyl-ACP methyl ester carboxylesterase [Micromonospora luteifusca]|uniref:Pimeloyl-ACP methyl ester carboxylesterase n=1 Tax=Micromonospora luteifusca TaxID=709860 RepID=A0ABS2LM71_9ACTN|nr:alpha/beta hydrolase [Micromonospora luteifusca]MBM7489284.1 pimeloyl-ACP methyl ester carboxylesterase [Micromonospora luteifusca]